MALVREQIATLAETSSTASSIILGSSTKDGSVLILISAVNEDHGIVEIVQTGATWRLVQDPGGAGSLDVFNGTNLRGQVWAAFNVVSQKFPGITISYSGGSTDRAIIVAEYSGDISNQNDPQPLDRRKQANAQTPAATPGTLDTLGTPAIREDDELVIGLAAYTPNGPTLSNPGFGYSIAATVKDGGNPPGPGLGLLDFFTTSATGVRAQVDHSSDPSAVDWLAIVGSFRGDLQQIAIPVATPAVGQSVTEKTDHVTQAQKRLISQFQSGDIL